MDGGGYEMPSDIAAFKEELKDLADVQFTDPS